MLHFTDHAKERVQGFLEAQASQGVTALRIAGSRAEPKLWLVRDDDRQPSDRAFDAGGFEVLMDPMSLRQLDGATVDFVEGVMQSGFRVFFESPTWDDPVAQRVQDVLDTMVNPGVASHGGTVTLYGIEGDAAVIEFGGGCQGCSAADVTLKHGVERMIREQVPEVARIVDATDHAAGENPYYTREDGAESPLGR